MQFIQKLSQTKEELYHLWAVLEHKPEAYPADKPCIK